MEMHSEFSLSAWRGQYLPHHYINIAFSDRHLLRMALIFCAPLHHQSFPFRGVRQHLRRCCCCRLQVS